MNYKLFIFTNYDVVCLEYRKCYKRKKGLVLLATKHTWPK